MAYSIHTKIKLSEKVQAAWRRLDRHRSAREKIWRAYVGDSHGLSPMGGTQIPLNGHALYARALLQFLAAHQPRLRVSTDVGSWKPRMELVGRQATRVMKEERFGFKQQRWVLDALMYSPGILKVCQEWVRVPVNGTDGGYSGGDYQQSDYQHSDYAETNGESTGSDGIQYASVLKTVVENVDWSDFVFDTRGTSIWNCDFIGHRVYVPIEDALANPMFQGVSEDTLRGMSGWRMADDDRLFFEEDDKDQPYRETVALWEIYDRCQNRVKIFPVEGNSDLEIYNQPWDGHRNGLLHFIDFLDVPNHVVGLSPLCMLHNLIEASNRALSKTIKQTDAAKTIARIQTGSSRAELETIMESTDGQAVYSDSGGTFEMVPVNGPDRATMMMVPVLKDLYNWLGGNINEIAGLGVSAPTATQGGQLAKAASGMISHMEAKKNEAVNGACEAIVHNELRDEVTTEYMSEILPDGQTLWRTLTPEQRTEIDAMLIQVDLDVYSMRYKSPEDRLQTVMQWWTQVAVPGYQIWQAQGGEYDMQALMRSYAELVDEPIINEIAIYSTKSQAELAGAAGPLPFKQSPVTTRTNIRQDRGGASQELGGALAQSLAGMEAA